jgi:hypothetical protein
LGATRLVKRSSIETEWCCATADHKAQQPAQFFIATPCPMEKHSFLKLISLQTSRNFRAPLTQH